MSEKKILPFIERYRPKVLDDVKSHHHILDSLKKFISLKTLPHLLFFGPPGTGKTSTIKCCANELYGDFMACMTLELNASYERGIETVRTKIKNFVTNKNSVFLPEELKGLFKLVILDEIDSMTLEAQGMLRQTIEKSSGTTRFCLICNDIDKISDPLQSRCTLYRFSPLPINDMLIRLGEICETENISYQEGAMEAVAKICHGDMRVAINTLQYIKLTMNKNVEVDVNMVYKITGHASPEINKEIYHNFHKLASNNKVSMSKIVSTNTDIVVQNNLTISNLLGELNDLVLESDFTLDQKIYLITNMAKVEIYESVNINSNILIMNLASIFLLAKNIKTSKKCAK